MTLIQVILYDMIPVWFVCTTGSCLLKYKEIRQKPSRKARLILTVLQLSWLERYTDNVEVGSSTLPGTTSKLRIRNYELRQEVVIRDSEFGIHEGGLAQLARASALHAEGQRFESVILHDKLRKG